MTKRRLCDILLLAVVLTAAVSAVSAAPFVTVTDAYGFSVEIPAQPERIVSLAPSNTEILFALGLGNRVAGVTDYCNYPTETAEIAKVGGYSTVNAERVVALNPDVVFASDGNTKEVVEHLKTLGLTVVAVKNAESVADTYADIRLIGEAAGVSEAAEILVENISRKIGIVSEQTAGLPRPKVVHMIWHDPIMVSAGNTFQDEMITAAGGVNAFADDNGWATIQLERFLAVNPDVIIVSGAHGSGDVSREAVLQDPRLSSVNAVKNNRVVVMDADVLGRAGPRIGDGIAQMASEIHAAGTPDPAATKASGFALLTMVAGLCCSGYLLQCRR